MQIMANTNATNATSQVSNTVEIKINASGYFSFTVIKRFNRDTFAGLIFNAVHAPLLLSDFTDNTVNSTPDSTQNPTEIKKKVFVDNPQNRKRYRARKK